MKKFSSQFQKDFAPKSQLYNTKKSQVQPRAQVDITEYFIKLM